MSPAESLTLDLDELERLAKAATPGPWWHARSISPRAIATCWPLAGGGFAPPELIPRKGSDEGFADAAYIAALSPEVVSELIRLARIALEARDE